MKKENAIQNSKQNEKIMDRRKFLTAGTIGAAAAAITVVSAKKTHAGKSLAGKELVMVIDQHRCAGCGACMIACKNENNVQEGFAWANKIAKTSGVFPNVKYEYQPTLCNHCGKAPCVRICPTKAMHKSDGGVTAHDPNKCIGCKSCIAACPYVVISYNKRKPHAFWRDTEELIHGCTDSAESVVRRVKGETLPYYNPDREKNRKGSGLRKKGIVEKCTFCDHRLTQDKQPYCVERCPAKARIFGDLKDPNSEVSKLLGKHRASRLREDVGTEPKVYYIRG